MKNCTRLCGLLLCMKNEKDGVREREDEAVGEEGDHELCMRDIFRPYNKLLNTSRPLSEKF